MKLVHAKFRCMSPRCKHVVFYDKMPPEQPMCPKCSAMLMELVAVKTKAEQPKVQVRKKK